MKIISYIAALLLASLVRAEEVPQQIACGTRLGSYTFLVLDTITGEPVVGAVLVVHTDVDIALIKSAKDSGKVKGLERNNLSPGSCFVTDRKGRVDVVLHVRYSRAEYKTGKIVEEEIPAGGVCVYAAPYPERLFECRDMVFNKFGEMPNPVAFIKLNRTPNQPPEPPATSGRGSV